MGWMNEWAEAATEIKTRLDQEPRLCDRCSTPKVLGYSNLGIGVAVCPCCASDMVARGREGFGED